MPLDPFAIANQAQELLDCACSALLDAGLVVADCCDPEGDNFRAFIAQGEVAWDACCSPCGQLSVRLVRIIESERPPDQAIGPHKCENRLLLAEWEILRIKCITVAENAEAQPPILPFPATISGEGRELLADLWSMWVGLGCCFSGWRNDRARRLDDGWHLDGQIVGPQGGCAGAQITVQTVVGQACDCRDPEPQPLPIP